MLCRYSIVPIYPSFPYKKETVEGTLSFLSRVVLYGNLKIDIYAKSCFVFLTIQWLSNTSSPFNVHYKILYNWLLFTFPFICLFCNTVLPLITLAFSFMLAVHIQVLSKSHFSLITETSCATALAPSNVHFSWYFFCEVGQRWEVLEMESIKWSVIFLKKISYLIYLHRISLSSRIIVLLKSEIVLLFMFCSHLHKCGLGFYYIIDEQTVCNHMSMKYIHAH